MNNMLDNAAACRPYPWAAELFAEKSLELFANQESAGDLGVKSAKAVELAGEQLASALAPGYGVLFCNTGTDALRAAAAALGTQKELHSLTTKAEHPALLHALNDFTNVQYSKIGKDGTIQLPPDVKADVFAVHHVNAETGIVQDAAALKKELPGETVFLLDTTQSVCKIPVPVGVADFLTVSGCKIGAPFGAALLYKKRFEKQIRGLRLEKHGVGRCVPAGAIVLAECVSRGLGSLEERMAHAEKLQNLLRENLADLKVRFTAEHGSPWITHLMLPGYQGGILVRMFQEKGITVAAGSACSSETPEPSAVLRAMGYSAAEAYSALRVSFFDDTTPEEVLFFANTLHELLKNY